MLVLLCDYVMMVDYLLPAVLGVAQSLSVMYVLIVCRSMPPVILLILINCNHRYEYIHKGTSMSIV